MTATLFLTLLSVLPLWKDVDATSVGAQTRRTELIWYSTRDDALRRTFRESDHYMTLTGEWDFSLRSTGGTLSKDGKITVPGNWEVQGYDIPIYVNHPYEFGRRHPDAGELPSDIPVGTYRRTFRIPQGWEGKRVYLNICGSKSGTFVRLNGQDVGYHEDSKDLARYDITPYLREGDNDLELTMYRWSSGSFLECQDFWRISGIERDIYLSYEAAATEVDFTVVSTLDESLENGLFRLQLRSSAPVDVKYTLLDGERALLEGTAQVDGCVDIPEAIIPSVRKWSAETPALYMLLLEANGEYTRFPVGFRRLEIKDIADATGREVSVFLFNGQPVKFKGVNMHEHNPYTGHYVDRDLIRKDILLMKEANINAIRTCHYPQPREFYELCDSLGMYVYDEANIESHGMGYSLDRTLGNNPAWEGKHLDRILNMYRRTANYPCVTILSLGNEAGNGVNFYKAYEVLKDLEKDAQNRPVCYERAEYEYNTDMIVPQYPGATWFHRMGEQYTQRPVCPSEYSHAMGNSTGSLDLQWDEIYKYVQLQGGFIWDWVDQGLYHEELGWAYGGDYGVKAPSDSNFLCNGIVNPDRSPHPAYYEVRHVYQDVAFSRDEDGSFKVFNRHYFKSLGNETFTWRVERDGKSLRKGSFKLDTPPQGEEAIPGVKLPRMKKAGSYRIIFEGGGASDCIELGTVGQATRMHRSRGKVQIEDWGNAITIKGGKVLVVFDRKEGIITQYKVRGKDMVESPFGIRPVFWRPWNDNDRGNASPRRLALWKKASEEYVSEASARMEGDAALLEVRYSLPLSTCLTILYKVYPDGVLAADVDYLPISEGVTYGTLPEIPRIGLRMRLPEGTSKAFSYLGEGPWENYCDRRSATHVGIWKTTSTSEVYPYVRPQETGHHTGTKWISTAAFSVVASPEMTDGLEFSLLDAWMEDLDCDSHPGHHLHISDIPQRPVQELCLDLGMTGVGGYDSWGSRPETRRTLWPTGSYSASFALLPAGTMKRAKAARTSFFPPAKSQGE